MPKLKRTTKKSIRRRFGRRGRAVLLVLLVSVGVIGGFVGYGLTYRAIVEFTLGGKGGVRQSYQLIAMSRTQPSAIDIVHVFVRNVGATGITVVVTMHALNAAVSAGYYGPYADSSNIQMYLPVASEDRLVTFYLTLPVQASSFTLSVTVGQTIDFSTLAALSTSTLTSTQPMVPTTLVYTQIRGNPASYNLTLQY